MPSDHILVLVASVMVLLVALAVLIAVASTFRLWLQAMTSGTPISIFQFLGMRFRRAHAKVIVRNLIAPNKAGVSLSCYELGQTNLQGCDVEKLVLAMIEANKRGLNITWQEAVDADLHARLQEKLKG